MRTLQEKYNSVLEGNFSKEQFRRDAAMQLPNIISKFNSFEDTATILKNRGMIAETKMQEPKYSTAKPADDIAPDVIDTGIKFELDKKYGTLDVTAEEYEKCKEMVIKNLSKDLLYYVKQDSVQLETPGEKMEKAKLNEGIFDIFKKKPTAKGPEVLSSDEIDAKIEEDGIEDVLDNANTGVYSLENATEKQVEQFLPVVAKMDNFDHGREYMIANALSPIKAYKKFAATFEAGKLPGAEFDLKEMSNKEISKDEAWKEFQEKRHVTDKTIEAAKKDFEKGWEEGKFRDGNYMTEETALDRAQDNAATKVQNTLGDIADTVAEKPASVAAAFRKMVLANPVKYAKMSASELEKEFEAFKLEEGHKYQTPKYSEEELAQISKDQQEHDEETLRRERGLEEGGTLELSPEQMEKLHKDGKITLPNGSVLHYTGKVAEEQQLKEAIKKLIAKVIAE